jgi:D-ribose pyranase
MIKTGIVHAELARRLAGLRHTDLFALSDSGLTVPAAVPVVDLGVLYGLPPLEPVLEAVLAVTDVEFAWLSRQTRQSSPGLYQTIHTLIPDAEALDHDDFKTLIADCRFVVRTGDTVPFSNVILRAGVPWLRR